MSIQQLLLLILIIAQNNLPRNRIIGVKIISHMSETNMYKHCRLQETDFLIKFKRYYTWFKSTNFLRLFSVCAKFAPRSCLFTRLQRAKKKFVFILSIRDVKGFYFSALYQIRSLGIFIPYVQKCEDKSRSSDKW